MPLNTIVRFSVARGVVVDRRGTRTGTCAWWPGRSTTLSCLNVLVSMPRSVTKSILDPMIPSDSLRDGDVRRGSPEEPADLHVIGFTGRAIRGGLGAGLSGRAGGHGAGCQTDTTSTLRLICASTSLAPIGCNWARRGAAEPAGKGCRENNMSDGTPLAQSPHGPTAASSASPVVCPVFSGVTPLEDPSSRSVAPIFRSAGAVEPTGSAYSRRKPFSIVVIQRRRIAMKQRVVSAMVVALLMLAAPAAAQQGTTEVRGRVVDPQGAVLPGVTVTVRNQDTGMYRETVSGPDGSFIASGIVPGTLRGRRRTAGLQEVRPPRSGARGRQDGERSRSRWKSARSARRSTSPASRRSST